MSRTEVVVRFLSVALLAFLCGFYTYHFKLFPYDLLRKAARQGTSWTQEREVARSHHLKPASYDRHGTRVLNEAAMQPGLTLLTSFWPDLDGKAGMKLIDATGQTHHQWRMNLRDWWPDMPPRIEKMNMYAHGSHVMPNGDILFNVEYQRLFMIDSCGKLKWRLDRKTHHSIDRDEDGNFWVPENVRPRGDDAEEDRFYAGFAGLTHTARRPIYEDRALKLSPDGELLMEISMLEVLYKNDLQRYIPKISGLEHGDMLHVNDIEVLDSDMADQYPLFAAGDLVISLRNLHMVMVMDPLTKIVKWYATDPWIEQHDPDFTGDGWITVFDNNQDFSATWGPDRGNMLGGSRLIAIRPHTGETRVVTPGVGESHFYTGLGGKFQLLDNGNYLITEAKPGRVLEVTASGELVWESINTPNEDNKVAEIMEGTRYNFSPEQVAAWPCSMAGNGG